MDKEKKYNLVYFEIVGFCNARYPWCVTGNKSLNQVSYPSRFINVNDFRNAIVTLLEGGLIYPRETIIRLENWGEPMLHPELSEILKILRKNDVNFAFSTNASKFVNLENDVLGNLQEIKFSVPGFSQSSYDRIHGFNLESILKNIEMFCKNIRKEGSGAKLVMAYHLYQFNIDEIDAAMKFCSLNGIEFSPYSAYLNDFNLAKAYLNKSISTELLGRIGKDLFLHYVDELIARTPQDYQCPQFNILAIDEYCNVLTCCALPKDYPEYSLGNLFTLSSDDIRKGKLSQKVCIECVKLGISSWVHNPWVPDFINIKEGDGGHLTRCKKNQAMDIIETGFCIICGQNSTFRFDNGIITPQLKDAWGITDEMADAFNHRESQFCSFCGSSLRVRQLCTALIQTFSEMSGRAYDSFTDLLEDDEFRRLRIAEINACGTFHNYLKQHPNLCYSEYVPSVPCGSEYNGIRCEDLRELTYPNDYFDIILTSDTLEHVPEPDKAWSEIRRTLKPGGYHIFTIPVVPSQPVTRQRARLSGGRTVYLTEPAYHSGEWGAEDQLVYTDFAMDVVDALNKLGLSTEVLYYKQVNKDVAFVFRSLKQRVTDVTKMEPAMLEWTGERFLPWIEGAQIHYEHLHRYAFAAHFVKGKKVLDLACGEGYGTHMLAREAEYVAGVEIDKTTVQHARSRHIKDNLEFIEGSILAVPIEGEKKFDVVVCFEAIEHIAEHDKLLSEVKRLLKDDGLFMVSTPNKAVYTDEPDYHNPFHIKELDFDEFKSLLRQYFAHMRIFGQRVYAGSNMWSILQHKSRGYIEEVVKRGDTEFYFTERDKKEPVYFIAIASDAKLEPLLSVTDSWLTDASNAFFNDYERLGAELQTRDAQTGFLETTLQEKVAQIDSLEFQIDSLEFQIQQIQQSIPMQLVNRYRRVVEKLLRSGTRRRHYYELGLTGIRVILNEGWKSFWSALKRYLSVKVWRIGRVVYNWLPISMSTKAKLVRFVMKYGGRFFQNVGSYRQWKQLQEREPTYKQPSPHPGFYDASKREPFNFPDAPSPVVSVIIPVHNKSNYTYACLYSIYENRPDVEFEVIVVDDCSTDDTQDLLKTIGGIQVIQNVTNLGFAGSVNCAAEVARGEYLLILNNDTLVHPGWMDELFAVMSSQPDIGLVGSQLIYPDGRLQESGCLMCQDGCAVPLGRFEDLLHPEFSYFREVDFCSAASILVRRKEFHKVGGLSTVYAPAYFEDVDFAFKLREIGKRVFVQPLSKVTHYEAASYSRELSADLIARNRKIFVEKWQRVLQQSPYTSPENFRTTPNYNHKRVLYIDAIVPVPDRGAGSIDAFWYMRFLVEAGYDVVFYGEHTPEFAPKYTPMIQRIGVQCLYQPYVDIERYLAEHGNSFSHVFVARVYQAMSFNSLIRRYCPNTRYIFNTVDVHFLREMRQAEVEKSSAMLEQAKRTRERELGIMEQSDATIVVSTDEKELLEREYGMKGIYHVPLVREVYGSKHPFRERRDLVFIGSAHLPNVDATYYFHAEIFPLIQRELPDVKFIVIGEYLRDALKERAEFDKLASDPSVELPGFVEDLSEYFEWIRVMVAPLRYGSGVKGKIVTGFQYGIPCVSTSIGTEGMGLTPEVDVLQAEDPVSFARAVVRLYTDQILWERLSENCMMFTREHFSEEIARRELLRIIA